MAFSSYVVRNDDILGRALERAAASVKDLTFPLRQIQIDFHKSQAAIWKLKSEGQYPPLKPSTIADKSRQRERARAGLPASPYPALARTGALMKSQVNPNDPHAISEIVGGNTLVLGTDLEYAVFHQEARDKDRLRKFLFIGPEAPRFAVGELSGRPTRWLNILNDYVLKMLEHEGLPVT